MVAVIKRNDWSTFKRANYSLSYFLAINKQEIQRNEILPNLIYSIMMLNAFLDMYTVFWGGVLSSQNKSLFSASVTAFWKIFFCAKKEENLFF